ncbi:TPA_asm: RHS repeat-associated core domain-containing protein, partial [Salmonella enterica subsp. enterica serovar Infantis]|nr:RHS repeat-associated core domain-containing protein [Salmonella enterica subsp. enterica serovar Infantis]
QQYDEETGLYYNRYRYYNPEQGRYISQDPIGLRGGWNLYAYPLNPVTNTDPLGLEAVFFGPFFLPFPLPKRPAQQEADANAAKALTKWWNDTSFDIITRDMVVMMIALYVTCSSNGDSAEDSANPNVGKDLTDEEKNELGGLALVRLGGQRMKMNGIRCSLQAHLMERLKIHMVLLKMPRNTQKDLELAKMAQ